MMRPTSDSHPCLSPRPSSYLTPGSLVGGIAALLCLTLARPVAHAEAPPQKPYAIVATRNIFDPARTPARSSSRPTETRSVEPVHIPKVENVTLSGVAVLAGEPTAWFSAGVPALAGARAVGSTLAEGRLIAVDTHMVRLEFGTGDSTETIELQVGQGLRREDGGAWRLVAAPAPLTASPPSGLPATSTSTATSGAASTSTTTTTTTAPATAGAGASSDILERMRKRREQEMTK